jgi:acetyl esterase/lipase
MNQLTLSDRIWRANARHIDRRVLRLVASQRALRVLFEIAARTGSALPRGATALRDADGGLRIRPASIPRDAPVLLYIHGGGFTIGSPRTHAALAGHLAAHLGAEAWLPRYRLAPEHKLPAARDDILAAYEAHVADHPAPVALCGDSAGGCLALLLAQHIRDAGLPAPAALGLIAPAADLSGDIATRFARAKDEMLIPPQWAERIRALALPGIDAERPDISPLKGDLTGLPPTLIQAGAEEALAEDAIRLVQAMDEATLDLWPGLPHVWHIHAGRGAAADRALAQMGAFLRAHATSEAHAP